MQRNRVPMMRRSRKAGTMPSITTQRPHRQGDLKVEGRGVSESFERQQPVRTACFHRRRP